MWIVVNKISVKSQLSRRMMPEQLGMTLLEALLAMMMLVVFTGIVALVMQFTLRFFKAAESGDQNEEFQVSNGVLIDQQRIQMAMDDLVEVLSQPGISMEGLAFSRKKENIEDACPDARPVSQWDLPMPEVSLPPGYRLCLWKTGPEESSIPELLDGDPPSIYLLQALPETLSSSSLPARRLFCRPRPFC